MSDPYLYYNLIKDTSVCGQLDFNCLKLKYEVNHDILLFILALAIQYPPDTYACHKLLKNTSPTNLIQVGVPRFTGKTRITGKTAERPERPKNNNWLVLWWKLLLINEYMHFDIMNITESWHYRVKI